MFGALVRRFKEVLPVSHCLSEGAIWGRFLVCDVAMLWHYWFYGTDRCSSLKRRHAKSELGESIFYGIFFNVEEYDLGFYKF